MMPKINETTTSKSVGAPTVNSVAPNTSGVGRVIARQPLASVLMAVHNDMQSLSEAIESILGQSFSDFEFLIIDDGSTDSTPDIISKYAALDSRISWMRQQQEGLARSLNEALALAQGKFIVRQDADDVSMPDRLSRMIEFLNSNPSISAAGSWCEIIDVGGCTIGRLPHPIDHDLICWGMIGYSAIAHPSAVIRKECFSQYGSYNEKFNEEFPYAEDYELWTRWIIKGARFGNVPEFLIKYRSSADQISTKFHSVQSESAVESAITFANFLLSENLKREQVLGLRQLIGDWPINSHAVRAVPLLCRMLNLPRFEAVKSCKSITLPLARKIVMAVLKSEDSRRLNLSGLTTAASLSTEMVLTRNWWTAFVRKILPQSIYLAYRAFSGVAISFKPKL